ncbi:hypothetical protein EJ05DRAFT_435379 [Pseudovirgaria hyperparasitica]|uniref:Autophagy-related protein 11 n=1 Tax=Pseudovirgaria hyperparasitica TaxID=470096 RepID=A0A6A6WE54_9PEZI|nr:uncharacterized protein EJ05DRAFT_435379 [Pseudovirgaria hyperparasitica]KAF2761003.1 hypothetical protein EJ05DRAFT_435379 [Pseudovirgaria hyperparasitica]
MSLQVYVTHTGQRLDADPVSFNSLEALTAWLSQRTAIPKQNLLLLTTRAKQVKLQALLTEKEIFAFDRSLFSDSQPIPSPALVPDLFEPDEAPSDISNHTDLKSWQNLFKTRKDWAVNLLEANRTMVKDANKFSAELAIVKRGVQLATGNRDSRIKRLEAQFAEARAWFEDVTKEQEENLRNLERDLSQLKIIPAKREFKRFISLGATDRLQDHTDSYVNQGNLTDFVDISAVRNSAALSQNVSTSFKKRVEGISGAVEKISADYSSLISALSQGQSQSSTDEQEPSRLFQEIETIVKKVVSDYEHVLGISIIKSTVTQVSKMALLHTRNYLPGIHECTIEMSNHLIRAIEHKNAAVQSGVESMRSIATIDSLIIKVEEDLKSLEIPAEGRDALESLAIVSKLPYVYGSLQLEAIRRHDWSDKMKHDSSVLAEEMAGYQEEEERRRRKWLKTISDFINVEAFQDKAPGFEVNIRGREQTWPSVTHEAFRSYIDLLMGTKGQESTIQALSQAFKEIDRPTKQQMKRAKGVKSGSVHEASIGKGSLMLRGDDEIRVLRESNSKLEEELKGSRSRIRKLEGLVHQQNHTPRLSLGSAFHPTPSPDLSTPDANIGVSLRLQDNLSRRSSMSSRRPSTQRGGEEKALQRRLLQLEGELALEKDTRISLENDIAAKELSAKNLQQQLAEANSLKHDIMENMEDQQKDFSNERRSLEGEISRQKFKIEELEDELDRILGSRDNEQHGNETRMQRLMEQLEHARKEAANDARHSQDQVRQLEQDIAKRDEAEAGLKEILCSVYKHLAPDGYPPFELTIIVEHLESVAQRTIDHVRDLESAVQTAKSEAMALRSDNSTREADLAAKTQEHDSAVRKFEYQLSLKEAQIKSLESELEGEGRQLHELRSKFEDRETGSEVLRKRVEEEETKVQKITTELTEARSHINSLDVELLSMQKKNNELRKISENDSSTLQERSLHVKYLIQRIFARNERLLRLLETLGYAISYPEERMVVQRISKTGNSTVLPDPNASLTSSPPTGATASQHLTYTPTDSTLLKWLESEPPPIEGANYADLLASINRFSLDTFHDAVLKRMKDFEHTARKWQKEARAYRDKAHRAASDAHDKIAFRSFKDGDLALFLPTRDQANRPWAAFNVGAPHYFLREHDNHRLRNREWLVARISKIEERVVDLSKTLNSASMRGADGLSMDERSTGGASYEDDNPFELSDGLRWNFVEAAEEKSGAPSTPGLGKSTVASAHVDAKGSIRVKSKTGSGNDASRTLNKSLDSRRSSANSSRKSIVGVSALKGRTSTEGLATGNPVAGGSGLGRTGQEGATAERDANLNTIVTDEVRKDLLWGP